MKIVIITIYLFIFSPRIYAQTIAENVAGKIANKMKDTLLLTDIQRNQIYNINMQLYNQKMAIRQQYNGSNSVGYFIQKVENTRDSLYHIVLPQNKFEIYQQKKKYLVNNN